MPEQLPWLITRDLEDSHALAKRLCALGHAAQPFACIARKALPFALPETKANLCILVSSVFGAQCLWGVWPQCLVRWPHLSVAALAPQTSQWLKARGVPVFLEVAGGAKQLAEKVAEVLAAQNPRDELLWLTGHAGAARKEQAWAMEKLQALTRVHRVLAYATTTAPGLEQQMAQWHGKRARMLFCSPSACEAFFEVRKALEKSPVVVEVACVGNSTLQAWEKDKKASEPPSSLWTHVEAFVQETFHTKGKP
ncbi:MAG: uroporphyrinogen-III synthase [Cystobacterineae bacterium]|nr:uroporphyrinogen-III synthase [Cystobacterineae bacterium]